MRMNWFGGSLIAVAMMTSVVVAQPPERGDGPGRGGFGGGRGFGGPGFGGSRPTPPVMEALDADGDGKISAEELKNATEALKKLDKDGDGELSPEELRPPRSPLGFFAQFDENEDGKITREEAPERMREAFDRMDVNDDGVIDASDIDAMRERFSRGRGPGGPGGGFAERVKEMDKDGDGKISKEEAPGRMKENFDRIDANDDGFIDEAEIRQMFERLRAQRDGRGGGGRPEGERPPRPNFD